MSAPAEDRFARYSRQMLMDQIGREGQQKLSEARVGLVGCGALGSVISNHLVRAGVGFLRIADKDHPEMHNLQRQLLFTEEDVARRTPKAEAAALHLRSFNSQVEIEPLVMHIDEDSLPAFAEGLDVLMDGTDNFPTRFLINDYSIASGVPWVYGGVIGASGMTMTIVPGRGPCLRCLVPDLPTGEQAPTADMVGVLNTVVAVIGSLEANEAIKLVVDPAASNRGIVIVDVWDLVFERLELPADPACPCCGQPNLE